MGSKSKICSSNLGFEGFIPDVVVCQFSNSDMIIFGFPEISD
jgi:hypothetical protein